MFKFLFVEFLEPFIEPIQQWLVSNGHENWKPFVYLMLFLFVLLIISIYVIAKKAIKSILNRKLQNISKDLEPYLSYEDVINATRYYIETKCQNIQPTDKLELIDNLATVTRQSLPDFMLNNVFDRSISQKFYILLADSGMGKTTFMINLFINYKKKRGRQYNIRLFPLSFPNILETLQAISQNDRQNTILLLDALDEDKYAQDNFEERISSIIKETFSFNKVIITCRSQFFLSDDQELKDTEIPKMDPQGGRHKFHRLFISPFDEKDIETYLKKKYKHKKKKCKTAFAMVKKAPNLMVRPMLLSYIDDLIVEDKTFQNNYEIYQELIVKWVDREASRQDLTHISKFKSHLVKFSSAVALHIYQNSKSKGGLFLTADEIGPLASTNGIELSELEMRSKSLLNRDSNGRWKFSHKSILEFFLANIIFEEKIALSHFNFDGLDQARIFLIEKLRGRTPHIKNQIKNINQNFFKGLVNNYRLLGSQSLENEINANIFLDDILDVSNMTAESILVYKDLMDKDHIRLLVLPNTDLTNLKFLAPGTTYSLLNESLSFLTSIQALTNNDRSKKQQYSFKEALNKYAEISKLTFEISESLGSKILTSMKKEKREKVDQLVSNTVSDFRLDPDLKEIFNSPIFSPIFALSPEEIVAKIREANSTLKIRRLKPFKYPDVIAENQ